MTQCPCPTGRPVPAALALGFGGAAMACLLARELLLACGDAPAMGLALALLPLCLAAGVRLAPRLAAGRDPADLLAPALGLLAVCLPLSLLVFRALRPVLAAVAAGPAFALFAGVVAFVPLGLVLGAGIALTGRVETRRTAPSRLSPTAGLALGAALGAFFVQAVVLPKLTPLNGSLDAAIGCCVAGVLCAAGAPDGRRMETWLSLLAVCFVVVLPLSGIIDERLAVFEWGRAAEALPTAPLPGTLAAKGLTAVLLACAPLAAAGLAGVLLCAGTGDGGRATAASLGAGLADAAVLLGLLFAFAASGGGLFDFLPALVAAYAAGQTLALVRDRKTLPPLAPPLPLLLGLSLGLALPSLLLF
ncbi:hypothetical protein [Solidesulfovibrio sp.]|uniref:hypothetical protein n=1 Tax=Solidesulfovibrio sp. TaxID=2910990 RepID=UPI0026072AAE|nr:hypothetical protein [Solidesulfovibrio sp.]